MDKITAFYQLIDPLKPLEATEQDLYVDWQKDLGADDVKGRLIRGLAPVEGDGEALWYALQRDLFVFCYQDERGLWYAPNPLLDELPR